MIALIVWAVSLALVWGFGDHADVKSEIILSIGFTVALGLVFPSVYAWEFVSLVPKRAREAEIAAQPPAPQINTTGPNWPIREAFFALCPDALDADNERWEEAGQRLLDLLSTEQIAAWGRPRRAMERTKSPLAKVPAGFWREAWFTYEFFDEDSEDDEHVSSRSSMGGPYSYSDLRFNRATLEAAWNALGAL